MKLWTYKFIVNICICSIYVDEACYYTKLVKTTIIGETQLHIDYNFEIRMV